MVEVTLGYFKQGDDLSCFLKDESNKFEAFHKHARLLKDCAARLHNIGRIIEKYLDNLITINANVHFITIDGPEKMLKELIDKELVTEVLDN